jgi:hypothetical protein
VEILSIAIGAGESKHFHKAGRYFEVMAATSSFEIEWYDAQGTRSRGGVGMVAGVFTAHEFRGFEVSSTTAQTIQLLISDEPAGYRAAGISAGGGGGGPSGSSAVTNRSGTITAGSVAQQVMAANSARFGFSLQNLSTADLWINELGTASSSQPSIRVPSGALYESPSTARPLGAVSIFGATTGQAFAAREW